MNQTPASQDFREQTLALLWILLFAGHWAGLTLLNEVGFLRREQIADWNEAYFSKIYLFLLTLTLLHLALRAMRREKTTSPLPNEGDTPRAVQRKGKI